MVQKQHSKTTRLFTLKKPAESSESNTSNINIIHRIASPLGRFHSRTNSSATQEESSEKHENSTNEHSSKKSYHGSPTPKKKKKRKPKKSLHKFASDKNQESPFPVVDVSVSGYVKAAQADSSIDSAIEEGEKEVKNEISTSETSDSVSISETSTQSYKDIPKIKNIIRRSLMIMPSKEETPRLSSPEKNIENARKNFLRGIIDPSRKVVCTPIYLFPIM